MRDFYNEKVIVVYGATGGLGEAICRELYGRAQKLVLAGRNRSKLETLEQGFQQEFNPKAGKRQTELEVWQVGTQNLEQNFAQSCRDAEVDGLIIATGKTVYQPFDSLETSWQEYEQLLEVNLTSVLRLALELLPYFRSKQGFLHISGSYASIIPVPYQAVYSASKAALLSFVQAVGQELRSEAAASFRSGASSSSSSRGISNILSISLIGGMATEMYYQSDLHSQFSALKSLEPLFIAPPKKVALGLLAGITRGKQIVTINASGWWIYHVLRRLPSSWLLWGLNKAYRPRGKR